LVYSNWDYFIVYHADGDFFSQDNRIVAVWYFTDCLLEPGQPSSLGHQLAAIGRVQDIQRP